VAKAQAQHERHTADAFKRWAKRDGVMVEWGNIVAGMAGQSFREVFATEGEAVERERQALAKEAIGDDRAPVAVRRETLHG
jgi:hypothetical protein